VLRPLIASHVGTQQRHLHSTYSTVYTLPLQDVAVVVGLIGALLGGGANFVIPAILNLRIFDRDAAAEGQQQSHRAPVFSEANLNRLLIVAGAAFMVVGTASVVQDAQHGHH
jgi:hypothetical protein